MTSVRSLLGFLALTLIIYSCRKEYSDEDGKIPGVVDLTWEFKEADQLYNGDMDSAYVQAAGSVKLLTAVGSGSIEGGEILLQVLGENIEKGTYANQEVFFQYTENGSVVFQSSPVQTSNFSVNINELDSFTISGTFSGTVQDGQGNARTINEGKFTVQRKTSDQPVLTGQLTVWSKAICFDGSPIEIQVADQTGNITEPLSGEPACNTAGTASFTLNTGIYTVIAICSNDTIRYDITIDESCTFLEVDFQHPPLFEDYLPLTEASYWEYNDLADASVTQRITADGEEVHDGRLYTRMVSDLGDTMYFRKEQNIYYEFRQLNFQEFVDDPPSIEMVILHDDYDAGQSWETQGVDVILSGIGVKIKMVSRILRRDYDDTFNGTPYSDLIEVETEILFSSDDGNTYQSSGSSYRRVYAKGKGIVYYYDLDRTVEWGIYNIFLNP